MIISPGYQLILSLAKGLRKQQRAETAARLTQELIWRSRHREAPSPGQCEMQSNMLGAGCVWKVLSDNARQTQDPLGFNT